MQVFDILIFSKEKGRRIEWKLKEATKVSTTKIISEMF